MSKVKEHFDLVASDYDYYKKKSRFYYQNLKKLLKSLVPKNSNVFEYGCGTGELLSSLSPSIGYGYDISSKMISVAKNKFNFKNITYKNKISYRSKYDYVFMADVIEHLEEPSKEFRNVSRLMNKNSQFILTMANPIWEPVLLLAEVLRLKMPEGPHRRITYKNISKIASKNGMKVVKHDHALLVPIKLPIITIFFNKYIEKYFKKYAFIEYMVFKKV